MNKFQDVLNQLKKIGGVSFVNVSDYINAKGETQNALINIGMSYDRAVEKDYDMLSDFPDTKLGEMAREVGVSMETMVEARDSVLVSLKNRIDKVKTNRSEGQKGAYEPICTGIKVATSTGELMINGFSVRKTVTKEVDYGEDTRKPLTRAKDAIRDTLKSRKFRNFKYDKIKGMTIMGEELVIN